MSAHTGRTACLLVAAAVLSPAVAASALEKSFDDKALREVEVQLRDAELKVTGSTTPRVDVSSSSSTLRVEQRGEVLHVDDEQVPEGEHVVLALRLPSTLMLKVEVASGDIEVEGVKGRVELKPVSGDVRVRKGGPLKIKAVSGEVEVAELAGDVKIETVSGSVRVEGMQGKRLKVKTISGDVRVKNVAVEDADLRAFSGDILFEGGLQAGGELEANAFSGDVELQLPGDLGFDLDAKSRTGKVRVSGALQLYEQNDQRVRAKAGPGGAEVRAKTFSGDVVVKTP